jgi:hypothetical protein
MPPPKKDMAITIVEPWVSKKKKKKRRKLTYPSSVCLAADASACDAMVTKPNPRLLDVSLS